MHMCVCDHVIMHAYVCVHVSTDTHDPWDEHLPAPEGHACADACMMHRATHDCDTPNEAWHLTHPRVATLSPTHTNTRTHIIKHLHSHNTLTQTLTHTKTHTPNNSCFYKYSRPQWTPSRANYQDTRHLGNCNHNTKYVTLNIHL